MKIRIKKANLKRLASLSALGAGALGAAGSAEASSIVFSGPVNAQIGSCPHCVSGFQIPGPGGASGGIGLRGYRNSSGEGSRYVFVAGTGAGKHGTNLECPDRAEMRDSRYLRHALRRSFHFPQVPLPGQSPRHFEVLVDGVPNVRQRFFFGGAL